MLKTDMYTITKTFNTLYHGLRWVSLAMSKDKTRYILNHINIVGKTAQASDGRRLHILTNESLDVIEDGLYNVIKQNAKEIILAKSDCDMTFPNTAQVIPQHSDISFSVNRDDKTDGTIGSLIFQLGKRGLARLDMALARDMLSHNKDEITIHANDNLSPVKFTSKGRVGVLMPLKAD